MIDHDSLMQTLFMGNCTLESEVGWLLCDVSDFEPAALNTLAMRRLQQSRTVKFITVVPATLQAQGGGLLNQHEESFASSAPNVGVSSVHRR